jgi:hypothetical protein
VIVQIHTGNHLESNVDLRVQAEALVASTVARFAERVSRVQVHFGDENSARKEGTTDKRCMMEARIDGGPPIAVTEHGPTLEQALSGAAEKLGRSLDGLFGRMRDA